MTVHQFNRARRWDRRLKGSYSAGVMDGFDARLAGYDRPDPLLSDYNLTFYLRPFMRHAQAITNAAIARSRGRADGWDLADREVRRSDDEDWIERQVLSGMKDIVDYLRIQDRTGESWGFAA